MTAMHKRSSGSGERTSFGMRESGMCLVSFSTNSDMQNSMYSMFSALADSYDLITIGSSNVKASTVCRTKRNFFVETPSRPGIKADTFKLNGLILSANIIRESGYKTVYFESVHVWNIFLMLMLGDEYQFVNTVHDVNPHDDSKSVLYCQKVICSLTDYVVIKSRAHKEAAKKLYGLSDDRLFVLEVWRDYPGFVAPAGRSGVFLFFGRLRKYKGLEHMLRIAENEPNVLFAVVGSPDEESLPYIDKLGALPNIALVAHEVSEQQMAEAMQLADWVILPYESASQSGVIVDAYRYSTPVIAYNVGAIEQQLDNGVSGILVEAGDYEAFLKAIDTASSLSKERYYMFAKEAYEFGYEHFSTQALSSRFADTFRIRKSRNG